MAKLDKEVLVKHSFWIGVGVFLFLWLIVLICLPAVDGSSVSEKEALFKKAKDEITNLATKGHSIEGGNNMATDAFTNAYQVKKKNLEDRKLIVWRSVYAAQYKTLSPGQEPLFAWPAELANHPDNKADAEGNRPTLADKAFGAEFDGEPQESSKLRDSYRDTIYKEQLDGFHKAILPPFYTTPVGPAYYLDSWQSAVRPVTWESTTPQTRDCWLAQEDLCVKLELVRVIREAIDSVARGKVVEREFKDRAGKPIPLTGLQADLNLAPVAKETDEKGLPGHLTEVPIPAALAAQIAAVKSEEDRKKFQDALKKAKEKAEQAQLADVANIDAAAVSAVYRIRNACWELELVLEKDPKKGHPVIAPTSTVKNVCPDGRTLARSGVLFRLVPYDANNRVEREAIPVILEGEPLPRYTDAAQKGPTQKLRPEAIPLPNSKFTDYLALDQIFTWYNSPVKRVDKIEVGTERARSHRTAIRPLQPAKQFPTQTDTTTASTTGASGFGSGAGAPMGGSSFGGPPGGIGLGGDGGKAGSGSTANQPPISPLRYIDVSEQVRRLPVGLVLVVDQAYVPEVLTAMANSRLQMWTTQVHWRHVSGVTAPDAGSLASGSGPGGSGPGVGSRDDEGKPPAGSGLGKPPGLGGSGPPMGGSSAGGFPPAFGSGFGKLPPGYPGSGYGPMGGGASDPGNAGALSQEDPNLVELAVYAIASLYEQPPVEKKDPAAAPNNGQPMGTPMVPPMGDPMGPSKMP